MYDNEQALLDNNEQASLEDNQDDREQGSCQDPNCGICEAKSTIAALWRESADNSFAIGNRLLFLHQGLTSEEFSEYMSNDLADLGISRSTGYRWMVLAAKLEDLFPNYLIGNALLRLTGGRGIFANFRLRDNAPPDVEKPDPSETPLTKAAREALAGLPAPPQQEEGDETANEWAKSFIQAMNRIRSRQRAEKCAAGKTAATQGESLLRKLNDFAADFGAEEFEKFREQMDRFFGPRTAEAKAERHTAPPMVEPEVEVQSKLVTQGLTARESGSESKAEAELASVEGEALHREFQSKLWTENAPAAQATGELVVDGGKGANPLSASSSSPAQSMPVSERGRPAAGKPFFQSKLRTDSASLRLAILDVLGIRTGRDKRSPRQIEEGG